MSYRTDASGDMGFEAHPQDWKLPRAVFGLGHADRVRNLTRRAQRALRDCSKLQHDIAAIRHTLLKTERI